MTHSAVQFEVRQGVGWITLNRPEAINAVNDAIRQGVMAAIGVATGDPKVRAVVIRAAGTKGFSVGADIKETREPETLTDARARLGRMAWIEAVAACPKPVVASVHGICMGGGMELALACDIRIAAPDAIFALPEINLGLLPGGGGTQRLPRLIGEGRALDMMLTGERLDARRALEFGLVTRVSATADSLGAETEEFAALLAAKPPLAAQYVKESCRGGMNLSLSEGLRLERNLFTLLLSTDDRLEAAAAFREKRSGRFVGR